VHPGHLRRGRLPRHPRRLHPLRARAPALCRGTVRLADDVGRRRGDAHRRAHRFGCGRTSRWQTVGHDHPRRRGGRHPAGNRANGGRAMTRPLAPSEVFHAYLDWQTDVDVELPAPATVPAADALALLYEQFPALGAKVRRTPVGFVLATSRERARVDIDGDTVTVEADLSAFAVQRSRTGAVRIRGRLHHALCDVTGILSVTDHLVGLLGIQPRAESIATDDARRWPVTAEEAFQAATAEHDRHRVGAFYAEATAPDLPPARPVGLHLSAARMASVDAGCAAAGVSLTGVIVTAAA